MSVFEHPYDWPAFQGTDRWNDTTFLPEWAYDNDARLASEHGFASYKEAISQRSHDTIKEHLANILRVYLQWSNEGCKDEDLLQWRPGADAAGVWRNYDGELEVWAWDPDRLYDDAPWETIAVCESDLASDKREP